VRETAKNNDGRASKEGGGYDAPTTGVAPKDISRERSARMLDPALLGSLTIEVVAQLGRGTMTVDELACLGTGEVVRLDTPLNGFVDLTLNDVLVARGEIVAVEDRFGVRVTEIFVRPQ
jgi:flagellar motor switch protein FliN/FliY